MSTFVDNTAKFPSWAGESPDRVDPTAYRSPSGEDWQQIVAEVLAHQTAIVAGFQTPSAALTTATTTTLSTGDAPSDLAITNMRTRINEIAAALVSHGIVHA